MDVFGGDPLFAPMAATLGLGPVVASVILVIVSLWVLVWKALALWHSARNQQKVWFVVLLIVNTLGILEIIYPLWFKKDANSTGTGSLFGIQDKYPKVVQSPAEKN